MEDRKLEQFYEAWSGKSAKGVEYDIEASVRKADTIASRLPVELTSNIRSALDFGCGYGAFLACFRQRLGIKQAVGVDFSASAIKVAQESYQDEALSYYKLETLDVAENVAYLHRLLPQGVDCILLIDLLEHVPDCKALVDSLGKLTRYFIIKLPVESSVVDNYLLPKEYPGSMHSNGHLREFDANTVHYFIRQLGFTPLYETLYVYQTVDAFPPPQEGATVRQKVVRGLIKAFKASANWLLPRKIFLRLVGGGGYFCIATYDPAHVLNP